MTDLGSSRDHERSASVALDTSGRVLALPNAPNAAPAYCWSDLSPFAQGYTEAMFADAGLAVVDQWGEGEDEQDENWAGFSDLAPETLATILKDCELWLVGFPGRNPHSDLPDSGRLFWEIRQSGKRDSFPPLKPYLHDDGTIRLSSARQPERPVPGMTPHSPPNTLEGE